MLLRIYHLKESRQDGRGRAQLGVADMTNRGRIQISDRGSQQDVTGYRKGRSPPERSDSGMKRREQKAGTKEMRPVSCLIRTQRPEKREGKRSFLEKQGMERMDTETAGCQV